MIPVQQKPSRSQPPSVTLSGPENQPPDRPCLIGHSQSAWTSSIVPLDTLILRDDWLQNAITLSCETAKCCLTRGCLKEPAENRFPQRWRRQTPSGLSSSRISSNVQH